MPTLPLTGSPAEIWFNMLQFNGISMGVVHCKLNNVLQFADIEPYFSRGSRQREGGQSDHPSQEAALRAARFEQKSARDKAERERFLQALEACGGNRQEAAVQLGIPRSTFYRKLKKYGI